jgi:hypothetical protein
LLRAVFISGFNDVNEGVSQMNPVLFLIVFTLGIYVVFVTIYILIPKALVVAVDGFWVLVLNSKMHYLSGIVLGSYRFRPNTWFPTPHRTEWRDWVLNFDTIHIYFVSRVPVQTFTMSLIVSHGVEPKVRCVPHAWIDTHPNVWIFILGATYIASDVTTWCVYRRRSISVSGVDTTFGTWRSPDGWWFMCIQTNTRAHAETACNRNRNHKSQAIGVLVVWCETMNCVSTFSQMSESAADIEWIDRRIRLVGMFSHVLYPIQLLYVVCADEKTRICEAEIQRLRNGNKPNHSLGLS